MKKKIFTTALAICLIVLSIAGTSLAYFTDVEEATNVFTAGNVDITLTYSGQTADDETSATPIEITSRAYPGETYACNAVITNVGSESAYVGAILTLNTDATLADAKALFTNLEKTGYIVELAEVTEGYKVYVVKESPLVAKNGETVDTAVVFDDIVIPAVWGNAEMQAFNGTKIVIKAYATQTVGVGFDSATNALRTAFADWEDMPSQP